MRNDTGFRRFKATIEGVEIGASVLYYRWNSEGVVQQLRTDGCPIGCGEPIVVGWPADRFQIIRHDGSKIQFDMDTSSGQSAMAT
jgi:hypothetical protein